MVIKYRKYRSRGIYFGRARHGWIGFVALTDQRVVCAGDKSEIFSLAFDRATRGRLRVEAEPKGCLLLAFDAADFYDDRKGTVEARYYVRNPVMYEQRIRAAISEVEA